MKERSVAKEHERTVSLHKLYALCVAEVDSIWADRSESSAAVHPDATDRRLSTVMDHLFGLMRRSHDQRAFHGRVDVLHTGEAGNALQFAGGPIHRNYVIAVYAHLAKEHAAEILRVAGYADQG